MGELTRIEHEELAGSFSSDSMFGGFIETLGGIWVPNKAEQVGGNCYNSWINVFDSIAKHLSTINAPYIYKDSADAEAECSIKAGSVNYGASVVEYLGETGIGPLTLGIDNYVYLDLSALPGSPVVAAVGTAWPGTPHVRMGIISMPATGHWLPVHLERMTLAAVRVMGAFGVNLNLKSTILHNTASPVALGSVPAGGSVLMRRVWVKTAFNGTGPSLKIGDAGDDDRLMAIADLNLAVPGLYIVSDAVQYAATTPLLATLTAGGSTAGEAVVFVEVWQ